eukprot:1381535-Pyramimonas_sp.AAC.1
MGKCARHNGFFLGNGWADWFSRAGAPEHRASKLNGEFYQVEFRLHQRVAEFMARAMHQMRTLGGWDPERQYAPVRAPSFPQPQVTAVEHQWVRLATGLMCMQVLLSYHGYGKRTCAWAVVSFSAHAECH